ncbi:MAG: hypothetical protein IMZ53_08220 [Thermoplasmata archaeon]|nr:hypothetical protein [Thermoplasmata archaeon]
MNEKGKVGSDIPRKSQEPKGGKQTSGKTQHARMTTAAKVENLNGMPKSV